MKVELKDDWFIDNGYFVVHEERHTSYVYTIVSHTPKWEALIDTIFRTHDSNKIVTPDVLIKTLNGETQKNKYVKRRNYVKKERPEGYRTIKERQAIVKKRNDNRRLK